MGKMRGARVALPIIFVAEYLYGKYLKGQGADSNSRLTLPVKLKRWNAAQAARVAP